MGPRFTFGQASSLESSSAELIGVELKQLSDNWRLLAAVEADLGMDFGIDARSMSKQTGTLSIGVECHIRANRYAAALRSGDLERMLRAGLDLLNVGNASTNATSDVGGLKRVDASELVINDPKSLLTGAIVDGVQTVLLDILLVRAAGGQVNKAFLDALGDVVGTVVGSVAAIDAVLRAAARLRAIGQDSGRAELLAHGIAIPDHDANQDPSTRFFRDMMIVGHLAFSLIDTSIVRVQQHGACIAGNKEQMMGRSRGGLTSKIHAVVDARGLPVRLALTTGEAHDNRLVLTLLSGRKSGAMLLADRGFDADWIRALVNQHGAWANIPPRRNRTESICFSRHLYRARNLVERFFNKIKQCRRVATRYDKLAANYLAFVKLASIRLWLRVNQSVP